MMLEWLHLDTNRVLSLIIAISIIPCDEASTNFCFFNREPQGKVTSCYLKYFWNSIIQPIGRSFFVSVGNEM